MNNDSIVRECVQAGGHFSNIFKGEGHKGHYTGVCTKLAPRPPRSSLASLQLTRPRTLEEMRQLAEQVWRQRGLALIDPLLINDDFARQALINEATRLYGRRSAVELEVQP